MKKIVLLILFFSLSRWSTNAQNFIRVTQSDFQQEVKMAPNQALEVRLPSNPSTGFGWYPANDNAVVKQAGDWEFISDSPSNLDGAPGTQITHFVSVAKGVTELELLYKRPWEDASQAIDSYKITIVSDGVYTGKEIQSSISVSNQTLVPDKNETTTSALPASFSWQSKCTSVKNQGSCGSCWTFGTSGAFEAVINIWDNKILDLSEQWLVNCATNFSGCSGGSYAYTMFINSGAVYETDETYVAKEGTCKSSYTHHEKAKSYGTVSNNLTSIKQALYDYGPMYVSICAGSNFSSYKSGILTKTDGTSTNHAVLLCGWNDNGGTDGYWIIKNSWGKSWGESGYIRAKYGISGLGQKVAYVSYKGVISHTATSVSDLEQRSSAQVFPNPSTGAFTISGLENENNIEVYDFVGKLVYQTATKNTLVAVDLKDKSQGIYFYKIINRYTKEVETGKIMVY